MLSAKEKKRLYDIEYRRKNKAKIASRKRADYEINKEVNKKKHREYRNRPENVSRHNEYCMQPEYVNKKRTWDIVFRSMKNYGEFWESAILVNQIEIEVRKCIPKNERLSTKRCVNANTKRNIKRRFLKAVNKVMNGEIDSYNQLKNFGYKRREFLKDLLLCKYF